MAMPATGMVGEHMVPMPHFDPVMPFARWLDLSEWLTGAGIGLVIPLPQVLWASPVSDRLCSRTIPSTIGSRSRVFTAKASYLPTE